MLDSPVGEGVFVCTSCGICRLAGLSKNSIDRREQDEEVEVAGQIKLVVQVPGAGDLALNSVCPVIKGHFLHEGILLDTRLVVLFQDYGWSFRHLHEEQTQHE